MNRIKQLRELHHMTQVRLSIEPEVAQETVSAYENGKHYPSYETLLKLSKIFNASVDYIMGLSDQMTLLRKPNAQEEQFLYLLQRLDERQKEKVLAYIQGIAEQ